MTGKEILHKMKEKVGIGSPPTESGKGKSKMTKHVTHGFHLVEGKSGHAMEDYVFAQFKEVGDNELGLFAIFDGHLSREIPEYLRSHLFDNILNEKEFWTETESAIRRAYRITDTTILDKAADLGKGGSTAVTAILINCHKLVVANVGDSRAVICKNGVAKQLSIDHEPNMERETIENKGGFITKFPGDVPQFLLLASDGVWKVMSNQEAVDCIKNINDAKSAAKHLNEEAIKRKSTDDISSVVIRFN
ncbi:protein phosphatase [Lithospermum erythrorhizon]|uniref:Protein phosphatase n=1 Tax=Lithospermum erythrorhizon TaxID=34254 RepID=A0AAV3Q2T1_LITER